jgi:hypothetical protein
MYGLDAPAPREAPLGPNMSEETDLVLEHALRLVNGQHNPRVTELRGGDAKKILSVTQGKVLKVLVD